MTGDLGSATRITRSTMGPQTTRRSPLAFLPSLGPSGDELLLRWAPYHSSRILLLGSCSWPTSGFLAWVLARRLRRSQTLLHNLRQVPCHSSRILVLESLQSRLSLSVRVPLFVKFVHFLESCKMQILMPRRNLTFLQFLDLGSTVITIVRRRQYPKRYNANSKTWTLTTSQLRSKINQSNDMFFV